MSAEAPFVCTKAAPRAKPKAAVAASSREWYVHQPSDDGWRESGGGLWNWHGPGTGWWGEWQDGYRASWAATRFINASGQPWWFERNSDNTREDDVEWRETMRQWEESAGEANVAAVAAGGTEGADDDRADEANVAAVEANVAAVAAEGTEGADGERSDVSSEVFCPQIDRGDPGAEADLRDYEEFVAEHGAFAIAELQQLAANCAVDR